MKLSKKSMIIVIAITIIVIMCVLIGVFIGEKSKKTKEIKDTTAPTIVLGDTYTVKVGYDKNLLDVIISADDMDPNPKREIIGDYDFNTIGEYNLTYKAEDSSGNVATKDFVLKVKDKVSYTESESTFDNAISKYKNDNTMLGIDVSKWQGDIDWEKVANAGVEFAILRMGYQNGFDGEVLLDPYFEKNVEGCSKNNIPISVYFSSYSKTVDEAKSQADWICEKLKEYNYTNINIAFDWENWKNFNTLSICLNDLNNMADSFMDECVNLGYKTMLYGSKTYLEYFWKNNKNYPVWLANYVSETSYEGEYKIWQFTEKGSVNGIKGDVDINIMYK